MKVFGIIYKITNKINGNSYIGQTTQKLNTRKSGHYYDARRFNESNKNRAICNALRKYEKDDFNWEIIDTVYYNEELSRKEHKIELGKKERYWIEKYDTYHNGYNETEGGEGTHLYDKKLSDITKKRIGDAHRGKKTPKKTKEKMSKTRRENKDIPRKPVVQLDKEGNFIAEYTSINHASEVLRLSMDVKIKTLSTNISLCCKGRCKSYKGFMWFFKEEYEKMDTIVPYKKYEKKDETSISPHSKTVVQLTLDGEYIAEYPNLRMGAEAVEGSTSRICKCCNGEGNQHKGFRWMYKEDYENGKEFKLTPYHNMKENSPNDKAVVQIEKDRWVFVAEYRSISEGARAVNGDVSGVSACCNSKINSYKGYRWIFKDSYKKMIKRWGM